LMPYMDDKGKPVLFLPTGDMPHVYCKFVNLALHAVTKEFKSNLKIMADSDVSLFGLADFEVHNFGRYVPWLYPVCKES
jgi:hypothetical protein